MTLLSYSTQHITQSLLAGVVSLAHIHFELKYNYIFSVIDFIHSFISIKLEKISRRWAAVSWVFF